MRFKFAIIDCSGEQLSHLDLVKPEEIKSLLQDL